MFHSQPFISNAYSHIGTPEHHFTENTCNQKRGEVKSAVPKNKKHPSTR
ncbi:hypothetical protein HMPREF9244_01552 [Alloscardovia omnicolens F0580]|uniref:Uncharacterized protein n=1 Tax=Alloscardovia omnicolens F0580 TaxID=1321816 RepID=U1SGG6_9BIFI|nr:hypothetical protein HMPREF9244_01552 [Alloscardovia omnicolens F0580]